MRGRIVNLRTLMDQDIAARGADSPYNHGSDDIVIKEFHLPVRENVDLVIRSQDVIHSVFLPHLRAQMNAVPGMATRIHMKPTITTDSMRTITANPVFDYILMCNKICGASHYNMQMPLTVEPDGAYKVWLSQQKGFETAEIPAVEVVPATDTAAVISNTTANIPAVTNEPKKN